MAVWLHSTQALTICTFFTIGHIALAVIRWKNYSGALSLKTSHCSSSHEDTSVWSSKELQRFDYMAGYQDDSPSKCRQAKCPIYSPISYPQCGNPTSIRFMLFVLFNTMRPRQKTAFSRWLFQMHFIEWKYLNFEYNLAEVCSEGCNWQQYNIDSYNGFALNRRQGIVWTYVVIGYRHISALGLSELIMVP